MALLLLHNHTDVIELAPFPKQGGKDVPHQVGVQRSAIDSFSGVGREAIVAGDVDQYWNEGLINLTMHGRRKRHDRRPQRKRQSEDYRGLQGNHDIPRPSFFQYHITIV